MHIYVMAENFRAFQEFRHKYRALRSITAFRYLSPDDNVHGIRGHLIVVNNAHFNSDKYADIMTYAESRRIGIIHATVV